VTVLSSGAELRLTGPAGPTVVCVNGGRAKELPGTWSATIEWLVRRLAPAMPELCFAEVRYRTKSWRRFDECVNDCRAAIGAVEGERVLLLGFPMGGAVAASCADEQCVGGVVGLAPWLPDQLSLEALRGKRLRVLHGGLDRSLPGMPGVSPALSRRGYERARALGASGEYTLIPGALHAIALRGPTGRLVPLPRANAWAQLVRGELARFVSGVA